MQIFLHNLKKNYALFPCYYKYARESPYFCGISDLRAFRTLGYRIYRLKGKVPKNGLKMRERGFNENKGRRPKLQPLKR